MDIRISTDAFSGDHQQRSLSTAPIILEDIKDEHTSKV